MPQKKNISTYQETTKWMLSWWLSTESIFKAFSSRLWMQQLWSCLTKEISFQWFSSCQRRKTALLKWNKDLETSTWITSSVLATNIKSSTSPFQFRDECTLDLEEPMQSLGVETAFAPGRPNFGGISKEPNHETFLTTVRQIAIMEVDEKGTEAVAVTYACCSTLGGRNRLPKVFVCNRPFIFLIREQASGLCLFIGRMMNPAQKWRIPYLPMCSA